MENKWVNEIQNVKDKMRQNDQMQGFKNEQLYLKISCKTDR